MAEQAALLETIDINAILDSHYDFRAAYEAIDHPDKELVLTTLASVAIDVEQYADTPLLARKQESDQRRLANMVRLGTLYFGRSAHLLAKSRAEAIELDRLQAKYDEMSWEERNTHDLWSRPTEFTRINTDNLNLRTAELDTKDILENMVAEQMRDAFNVAYQGETRLPYFAQLGNNRGPLDEIIASGIILAERLGGFSTAEFAKAATSKLYGDDGMVITTYRSLLRGMDLAGECSINGEKLQLVQDYSEIGYALLRSSSMAGRYVLRLATNFWPKLEAQDQDDQGRHALMPQPLTNEDVMFMCRSAEDFATLISRRGYFPPFSPELFVQIVENIEPNESGQLFESYDWVPKFADVAKAFKLDEIVDVSGVTKRLLAAGHNDVAWDLYSSYRKERLAGMEIFKSGVDEYSFLFAEAIMDGNLTDEHTALGITETGSAGIEQLRQAIRSIEQFILADERTDEAVFREIERIENSPLYARLWKVAVRFNVAVYGSKGSDEILRVLNDVINQRQDSEVPGLNLDIYRRETDIPVNKRLTEHEGMNPDAQKVISQFCEYATLAWSSGPEITEEFGYYEERVEAFRHSLLEAVAEIDTLVADADQQASEKRRTALNEQRTAIVGVLQCDFEHDLLTEGGFVEAYKKLCNLKMARGILREKALRDAKHAKKGEIENVFDKLTNAEIVEDKLATALDLVDHIVVQEYLLKRNPNDEDYKRFVTKTLFNTSVIETALSNLLNKAQLVEDPSLIPKKQLTIVPSRDVGLELSGQIGDACWAGKYGSIAAQMPNLTAVLFAEGQEGETKSLVGSSLFIEAETETGEKLLIVRGLNPTQNFIGSVDSHDFLNKFMHYAKETAERAGRKLAMVYDRRGGASTNRPALFNAMTAYVSSNNLATIDVPADQVQFNGYTLKGSIYLVG